MFETPSIEERLRDSLDHLHTMTITSPENLLRTRQAAFEEASDMVASSGVSADESLTLLKDHAEAVEAILAEKWPDFHRSSQGVLSFKDHFSRGT
jgi:hypothetical protein